jgi:hypothetical protein
MKTPREILSERHQSADPKLEALRKDFVAELSAPASKVARSGRANFQPAFIVAKLWQELILPYRRAWTGLAAIWLVILGVNFVASVNTPQVTLAKVTPPTTEVLTALREQNQMLAQLLGPIESTPARRVRPGPSSQRREESYAV